MEKGSKIQMSESFILAFFLSLSGGLQDAYTYFFRGNVFANAQTGNIVLFSHCLFSGEWHKSLRYFASVSAFALGIAASESIRHLFLGRRKIHWRQIVVAIEITLLFFVAFLPKSQNMLANALVSFSCAMQVQSFRKVGGHAFSSTMCIGNMRSGMEALTTYLIGHERKDLDKGLKYWAIIIVFALGAGLGGVLVRHFGAYAIWASCILLLVGFLLMFLNAKK